MLCQNTATKTSKKKMVLHPGTGVKITRKERINSRETKRGAGRVRERINRGKMTGRERTTWRIENGRRRGVERSITQADGANQGAMRLP